MKGIQSLLDNGTIAGSMLTLNLGVKNMIDYGEADVWEAVAMATCNPAAAIGISDRKGSLEAGMDADIAIFDADFNTKATIIGGRTVFEA